MAWIFYRERDQKPTEEDGAGGGCKAQGEPRPAVASTSRCAGGLWITWDHRRGLPAAFSLSPFPPGAGCRNGAVVVLFARAPIWSRLPLPGSCLALHCLSEGIPAAGPRSSALGLGKMAKGVSESGGGAGA